MGIVTAGTVSLSIPTQAALSFDAKVVPDVIFGDGNGNGAFTIDQQNGVELGLRAKVRGAGVYNSNADGTYTHQAGTVDGGAIWNFEWSVNTDYLGTSGGHLNALTYALRIDTDPGVTKFFAVGDPINGVNPNTGTVLWDHGIGNNSTANGAGDDDVGRTVASYAALIAGNNVAQNSWRPNWFGINQNVNGIYSFQLEAFNAGASVAMTEITVNVVPEPSTYLAGALLLLPFGASTIRFLRKNRAA